MIELSRRAVLIGGGAGLISVSVLSPPSGARATGPTRTSPPVVQCLQAVVYEEDWSLRWALQFPTVILFDGLDKPAKVDFAWDDRVFGRVGVVMAEDAAGVRELRPDVDEPGKLSLVAPAGTSVLVVPVTATCSFPDENLSAPRGSTVIVDGEELTVDATSTPSMPWGAELFVDWGESEGFSAPYSVTVISTGPNPIPAGAAIHIQYSARASAVDAAEATVATSPADGDKQSYEIRTDSPVEAGDTLFLELGTKVQETFLATLTNVGLVTIGAPADRKLDMRETGRTTVAPLTSSGTAGRSGTRIEGA